MAFVVSRRGARRWSPILSNARGLCNWNQCLQGCVLALIPRKGSCLRSSYPDPHSLLQGLLKARVQPSKCNFKALQMSLRIRQLAEQLLYNRKAAAVQNRIHRTWKQMLRLREEHLWFTQTQVACEHPPPVGGEEEETLRLWQWDQKSPVEAGSFSCVSWTPVASCLASTVVKGPATRTPARDGSISQAFGGVVQ